MRRIGTDDGKYHNADVLAGVQGTVVDADALNAIQEEIVAVIIGAGMTLNPALSTQLRDAITAITGGGVAWGAITGKPPTFANAASFLAGRYLVGNDAGPIALKTPAEVLSDIGAAPIADPTLTGVPKAPTAALGTNTAQIATTAYVLAVRDALVAGAPGAIDTLNELAAAMGNDANFSATVMNALAGKQPTITDGSLSISRTQGLQTAIDSKANKDSNTFLNLGTGELHVGTHPYLYQGGTYGSGLTVRTGSGTGVPYKYFQFDDTGNFLLTGLAATGAITSATVRATGTIMAAGGFQVG